MSSKQVKKRNPVKRRTSGKKRTKKVNLDKNKVRLLCGIIFLICCVCIAFNIVIQSAGEKQKTAQKTTVAEAQIQEKKTTPKTKAVTEKKAQPAQSQNSAKAESSKVKEQPAKPQTPKSEQSQKAQPPKTDSTVKKQETASNVQKNKPEQVQAKKDDSKTNVLTQDTKKTESSPFLIPPAKNNATLVFVIDDAGLNVEYTKKYATLPFPLTIAVLPKLVHSKDCAYVVRSNGKELILHQPMQSLNHNLDPGPGKISVDMSFAEISAVVNANLVEIGPGVKGLNNHEGSEVTGDVLRIGAVLDVCQQNGIYFLDSRTTANTQAPQAALERDMKIYEKSGPYIDNVVSRQAMLTEIYKSLEVANKKGCAIVIGHVDKSVNILPDLLLEMYPYIKAAGYRFATPSTLR